MTILSGNGSSSFVGAGAGCADGGERRGGGGRSRGARRGGRARRPRPRPARRAHGAARHLREAGRGLGRARHALRQGECPPPLPTLRDADMGRTY